jgi:hypothetical protein
MAGGRAHFARRFVLHRGGYPARDPRHHAVRSPGNAPSRGRRRGVSASQAAATAVQKQPRQLAVEPAEFLRRVHKGRIPTPQTKNGFRRGDEPFLSPFCPLDDSRAVSSKILSASNEGHQEAILQNSSRFSPSEFKSLPCSTTLIRVKNVSQISRLDRRVGVAPMMDYTDARRFR